MQAHDLEDPELIFHAEQEAQNEKKRAREGKENYQFFKPSLPVVYSQLDALEQRALAAAEARRLRKQGRKG